MKSNNMLNIKIKKLAPEAVIPQYSKPGDAGMDVYAISKNETDKFVEYGTGLAFEVPEGYVLLVFARSSVSNTNLILANSVGVLDSGYRGELKLRFRKIGTEDYQVGERVGQIMVLPYPQVNFEEVAELSNTERGEGGFGSSGKN
jgi:dUTP pyrophosphatase